MARGFERLMKDQAARDELLSAYLDDQLDVEDRARLEARLAADPALRSELEMLRRTVALVRDLPQQPIPRNFILPQAAAPKVRPVPATRRPGWLAPFLTAATTAVSLLFVAVLAGDLLFSGVGDMTQLAAPAPVAEGAADSAPAEKAVEEEREAPQMLTVTDLPSSESGEEPSGVGEGENLASPGAEYAGTPPPATATLPEAPETEGGDDEEGAAEPTPVPEGTPVPATGGGGESPVAPFAPTPTPAAAKEVDTVPGSDTPAAEEVAPAPPPEPAATEPTERILRATEPIPDEAWETEPPPDDGEWGEPSRDSEDIVLPYVTPWRAAEVALGVFALLLILATIWAWRTRRR
jgi:hypothetical protein